LSFYERARIVVKAVEQGVYPDLKTALNDLFANVSRTKRSKIKSFTVVVEALDGILHHPTVIGERLGLDLAKRLENPDECAMLRATLSARPAMSAEEEQTFLSALISVPTTPPAMQGTAVASSGGANARGAPAAIEVTFDAGSGRIILEGPGVDSTLAVALERWLRRQ
jgi:ParB family transcriptional regulator, chromosome partitioning protein